MADNKIRGRTGGVLNVTIDGVPYEISGNVTFRVQRFMRETTEGVRGPTGHKQSGTIPFVEFDVPYKRGVELEVLLGVEDATVQLTLYNGESWVYEEAYQVGELDPDAVEGQMTVRIETSGDVRRAA